MYDYREKLKGLNDRRSIYDILSLNGTEVDQNNNIIQHQYEAVGIDKVKIDGNTFSNYGAYQFIWEKTFVKSPERSANGSLGNLNSYATFVTPHLIMDFSVMSIDDYRAIMRMHYERNEFVVECYDPIYNKTIKAKMYFGTEEMAKLFTISKMRRNSENEWEEWVELVGVQGYKVELIGTNNDLDLISVVYHLNPPSDTGYTDQTIGEEDVYNGEEVVIGASANSITSETFGGLYKFKNWNLSATPEDENKGVYINDNVYTVNQGNEQNALVLYAQWQPTTTYTLSYNYGLADPSINEDTYNYIYNKTVTYYESIGALPYVTPPTVKYNDINGIEQKYSPYYNGRWYKTPIKATNSQPVEDNTPYWANRDSTVYLLYDVRSYELNLYLENALYQSNNIEYNTATNLPQLVKNNYKFDGWYTTPTFQEGTKFTSNKMPPYSLTLYARWLVEQ